jgi:hypothetical protein
VLEQLYVLRELALDALRLSEEVVLQVQTRAKAEWL